MKKFCKRLFRILLVVGLLCGLWLAGINIYMVESTRDRIVPYDDTDALAGQSYDCVLVLGAGVRPDGSPSHMLADRVETGLEAYFDGLAPVLLMSGDHGREDYDEVGCMLELALAASVPAEDVFLDHAGFSTYESILRAKEVFGAESLVIVTQGYHLHRALYVAEKLGLEAVGIAADRRGYSGQFMRDMREVVARGKDALGVWIGVEPTYLGEGISLTGDGRVTQESEDENIPVSP